MKVTEDLQLNGLSIVVDKAGFTYGSDAVLLANFARPGRGDSCLDLGAGTGILAILVNGKTGARFTAVEIQPSACQLMEESIALNGQGGDITVLHADIRRLGELLPAGSFDGAVCNPALLFRRHAKRKSRRGPLCPSGRMRHLRRGPVRGAAAEKRRQAMAVLSRLPPCGVLPRHGGKQASAKAAAAHRWKKRPLPRPYGMRKGRQNRPYHRKESVMLDSKLYLCPTPIGNMEDMTLRALRVLRECHRIYCEDTRNTGVMLSRLGISKPLISCHEHNEEGRAEEIAGRVAEGEAIAFVSDAGLPGISDPGERLVAAFIQKGLPFEVLPGPSASLTALVLSGLPAKEACFVGFLPRTGKERREAVARLARHKGTLIVYESPLRVAETAAELAAAWGDRKAVLCRELTKLYEETVRSTLSGLAGTYAHKPPKGETVLVIAGARDESSGASLEDTLKRLLGEGVSAKDAAKQASALLDVPRNEAYKMAMRIKEDSDD